MNEKWAMFSRIRIALGAALAFAYLMPAISYAQDLPTVGDYRFPIPKAKAKPSSPSNQEAAAPKPEPKATLDAEPLADQPDEPVRTAKSAEPAAKPKPGASPIASGSINFGTKPNPAEQATTKSLVTAATSSASAPKAAIAPSVSAANTAPSSASVIEPTNTIPGPTLDLPRFEDGMIKWNVHSAKDVNAQVPIMPWQWLAAFAFALGIALTFLFQQFLNRRHHRKASAYAATYTSDSSHNQDWPAIDAEQGSLADSSHSANSSHSVDAYAALPDPDFNGQADVDEVQASDNQSPFFSDHSVPDEFPDQHIPPSEITLNFTARQLSATLMNTVLDYELEVTNDWHSAIGPITIGGDMISAHASMPARAQLEITGQSITPLHTIAALAPGESAVVSGELRLALAAIIPIQSGDVSLFVPLARFRVEALRRGSPPICVNFASVVGESQPQPDAALKPFRLDLGPRLYSDISQRELDQVA